MYEPDDGMGGNDWSGVYGVASGIKDEGGRMNHDR
jgi:hypothetical protein